MRWIRRLGIGLIVLIAAAVTLSAASNLGLPTHSPVVERLSEAQKARVAEATHLRSTLGDSVWPGWAGVDIPILTYNEEYAFLVGLPEPAAGWTKVPQGRHAGDAWEPVPEDTFQGEPYYRLRLPASGQTPEAFTVMVGDRWVTSMQTREWMRISFRRQLQNDLPPVLAQIVPYRLVDSLFLGSSDVYVSLLLHESFHAYQGIVAPARLAAAEHSVATGEPRYPWDDDAVRGAWQVELDTLADAVEAESVEEAADLARQFLVQREQRRNEYAFTPALVGYERQREWLEGSAKYVELMSLSVADSAEYAPVPALADDPDFNQYTGAGDRWQREVDQIRRIAGNDGDGRFYYSGFAQAVLLDRLAPGWQPRAMNDGVWLEDLLAGAVAR